MPSIHLTPAERQDLLDQYRRSADPAVGHRAHILLLLDAGFPWATISAVLFCSVSTISRWKARFEADGVDAVCGRPRGRPRSGVHVWAALVVRWVLTLSPTEFRFARSRWSCEAVAVVLRDDYRVRVGRETVRLWLRDAELVWRQPRPVSRIDRSWSTFTFRSNQAANPNSAGEVVTNRYSAAVVESEAQATRPGRPGGTARCRPKTALAGPAGSSTAGRCRRRRGRRRTGSLRAGRPRRTMRRFGSGNERRRLRAEGRKTGPSDRIPALQQTRPESGPGR